jgi:glycosyltransferase involved in cell wall biosynthesis
MKIAIINITGGGMSGGYRKYLQNVIPLMTKHDDVEAILCVMPKSIDVQNWFDPIPNINFVTCRPFRFLHHRFDSQLHIHLEEFSPDVIFVPVERSFRFRNVPVINMIQNMEPFVVSSDGNTIGERFRQWVQYVDGRRAIKKSDGVIVLSRFVSGFLETKWKIPMEKIGLVYHGIDASINGDCIRPYVIPKGWDGHFIFTAGSIRPARGLEDLFFAMKQLSDQGERLVRLVIAGESGRRMDRYQKKLKDWVQKNNLSDRICWAGSMNENEMAWCYQNCSAFVMTSRVESFGMIAGEAMSYGCICISADNPCLPELFGDAALYYPPKDYQSLAEVIKSVLLWDYSRRKISSEKARKRVAEFSWDVCAEKTITILSKAVEEYKK